MLAVLIIIENVILLFSRILRFDDAVNFDHALIGRAGPGMGKETPSLAPSAPLSARGMSTEPEGCQKVPYYSLEPGALKFGDKPHSHTQLYLNFKKFWEKKYAIEFDFRTYYPNGLLFITPVRKSLFYLSFINRQMYLTNFIKVYFVNFFRILRIFIYNFYSINVIIIVIHAHFTGS